MRKSIAFVVALLVLSPLAVGSVAPARGDGGHFSNTSLHGSYVVSFHGWVSGGDGAVTGESLGPQNGIGLLTADGHGNFTDTVTANILYNTNGNPTSSAACGGSTSGDAICNFNVVGTYSVNSNGTGTTTATATPAPGSDCRCGSPSGFTTTSSFVLTDPNHLAFVGTDLDATVVGEASRQGGGD